MGEKALPQEDIAKMEELMTSADTDMNGGVDKAELITYIVDMAMKMYKA